ncbi:nucleotidyltransferase family protein [Oribacterium sp. P6A1]|uniref:nucleotidyltransferase family protein n=1 Tax=Oribacterium sp. P6A1 TaxID=1410612 RepID=UPI00068A71F1|nr:nucleotidyltransferase family protein [Oribacterium sp. P6A1]
MNRTVFEGRYLINLVGAVIKQKEIPKKSMKMDWERLFRLADYHKIANVIYLGMLGASEHVPQKWGERFFERYQESLMYSSSYENSELEILTLLNMHKITATVLESSATRRLYRIPESASNSPLRLLLSEKDYSLAKGFLVDLGYLTDHFYPKFGEHMRAGNGFMVEIYYKLPFITKNYQKCMTSLMERAYIDRTFNSMHTFSLESSFVFRMAEVCYNYCENALTVRKLLDVFLFYHQFKGKMNQNFIWTRFKEFKIDVLVQCMIHIAAMWFGSKADDILDLAIEDGEVYDGVESRILTSGVIGTEMVPQANSLRNEIQKELEKEKREEEKELRKKQRDEYWKRVKQQILWVFPEYKYMISLYPSLEKFPFLLPLYWIFRGIRMIKASLKVQFDSGRDKNDDKAKASGKKKSGDISYLPRETKTTRALENDGMGDVAVSIENGNRTGKIYDSVLAEEQQRSKLEEEIKASADENVTEDDFRIDENAETEIGLWEFPKLESVSMPGFKREDENEAISEDSDTSSQEKVPASLGGDTLSGMDVSLFNNLMSNDKNRTSDKVTITSQYTDSGNIEYGFTKENEENDSEPLRTSKESLEPDIIVAQDENHNSVGVRKWHFPTIEEVEEKEDT